MLFRSRPELARSDEFPAVIDAIRDELRQAGFMAEADRLHNLVHEMVWTTSTELYGELRLALKTIRQQSHTLPADISSEIRRLISSIDQICRQR